MPEPLSLGERPAEPWEPVPGEGAPAGAGGSASTSAAAAAGLSEVVDVMTHAARLLDQARADARGKASMPVVRGPLQRAVLVALAAGGELGEHGSPPAATLHTLIGEVLLHAAGPDAPSWLVPAGSLVPIPAERHGVRADIDSVFLLTVTPPNGG